MEKDNQDIAKICYKLFEESGQIGYYQLYKDLHRID